MRHLGTQTLQTPRLTLRRYTPGDAPAMFRGWMSDAQVARWMFWEPYPSLKAVQAELAGWVQGYADPCFYRWAIELRENSGPPQYIGSIGLTDFGDEQNPSWQPAYVLSPAYWGHGYAGEALCAVAKFFFEQLGGAQLFACHAVQNPASGQVLQKAGFVHIKDGSYTKPDGETVPAHFYALDKKE